MSRIVNIEYSLQENTKEEAYKVRHFSNGTNINILPHGSEIKFSKLDMVHVTDDENGMDFTVTVLRDNVGNMFYTSSEYFTREAEDVLREFKNPEVNDGLVTIRILKKESKNRKDSDGNPVQFLTCELG